MSLPISHHASEPSEEEGHEYELEADEFDHEILGRYKFHEGPEGDHFSHIYEKTGESLTNEEIEGKKSYGLSEDNEERASPRTSRPMPPLPVSIMSSQHDLSHQENMSQGSIRPLPQPPRTSNIPLPETEIEDQGYVAMPRLSYRPIPPVPVSVDDGTL
jgi:hypothetical protein